eukprot:TRINITY_DN6782_c0_g1_i1.p1 TRINITY_DN6782_c0_g1~~TRINITY_DN6782_c0_g1_i1.p1  ORF type:complete len:346 (-),score=33.65 TRINITY_DN6782_c0_g1_i1:762-1799(-)
MDVGEIADLNNNNNNNNNNGSNIPNDGLGMKQEPNRRLSISAAILQNAEDIRAQDTMQANARRYSVVPDIDSEDKENPHAVSTYAYDIYQAYRLIEDEFAPKSNYMDNQKELKPRFRTVLADWMFGLCCHHKLLLGETFYLAMNIVDRFLSTGQVKKDQLQLVGAASLLIASKYEEVRHPSIDSFVQACGELYTKREFRKAERLILEKLDYLVSGATQFHYLQRSLKAASIEERSKTGKLVQYLVGLAAMDYSFLKYRYSLIVVAAIFVALLRQGHKTALPYALKKHSRYTEADVVPCAKQLYELWKNLPKYQQQKHYPIQNLPSIYKQESMAQIALMPVPQDLI